MAKYFSLLPVLLGIFILPGSPLVSSRDIPPSQILLVKEPEDHYYLVKKTPAIIKCQASNAAEIIYTCNGIQIPATSVEQEDVSDIDPRLSQAKIEVTRADVQNYEGGGTFWCMCGAVDAAGIVTAYSRRAHVTIAFLKKFTASPASITATVNENVQVPCGAPEGHPKPQFMWKKDKKRLEVENNPRFNITEEGDLLIQSATVGDGGSYQCVVRNIAGKHESKGISLKVSALEESSEPQVAISNGDEENQEQTDPGKPRATRQTYKTYFTTEPAEKYYVAEDKSVLIDCSVKAADILTFRCNGKRMDRERQITSQGLDESRNRNIQSHLNLTYADVQKYYAEAGENPKPYQCVCVAWFQDSPSPNGWGRLDSRDSLGHVFLAYLGDTLVKEPSDVTAAANTDATMTCEPPKGDPNPWVYWYKNGSRLDVRSGTKYMVTGTGDLRIHKVQAQDAGAYHCVVENVAKSLESKIGTLTVIATAPEMTTAGPSEDDFPEFPEDIPSTPVFLRDFQPEYTVDRTATRPMVCAAISADQLTIDCGGRRLKPEEYEFISKSDTKSGKRLLYVKASISGESVAQKSDTFFCQCTAWSLNAEKSWDRVLSAKGYIKLETARTVYIEDAFAVAPEDTEAFFEADAQLLCEPPLGNPTPEVHWLKDGVLIDSESDPNYVLVEGNLIIEYVRVIDEGQYTCVAENEAGKRSTNPVQLTVLGKPQTAPEIPQPETSPKADTTTHHEFEGPFFSLSPEAENYIFREQSVNLSCLVIAASSLVFVCNGEVVQSTIATDMQIWDSNIKASVNENSLVVTKETVDQHTGSLPYTCVCRAYYVEDNTKVTEDSYVDSSPAVIQVAFLGNHFLREPSDVRVAPSGTAELVCEPPTGIPKPEVNWLKNGFRVPRNERIHIKDNGNLVINSFTAEDEGSYICMAESLVSSRTSRTAIVSLSDDEHITKPDVGHTPETGQAEPETTTHEMVPRPYFDIPYISKDLQPVYYLITEKPVTITCEAYDVKRISFICGMKEVEDVTVLARVEQQTRSNGQSEPVSVLEASVNVSKEKVENYEAGKEYACNCLAHYFVSGDEKIINGSRTVVKIAYLNEEFEKEPESQTVTEGEVLTIDCMPPQGNPEPEVSWIKDGESFKAVNIVQNNVIVFTEAELEHTGEYICVAENVAGRRQSSAIIVEVKAKSDASSTNEDTDGGDNEFDVDKESDEEPGRNVTEEAGSVMRPNGHQDMKEHDDEEAEIRIDVLKTEQQEQSIETWSAKNASRQTDEDDENYLEKNQMSVLFEETDNDKEEEYDTESILEGGTVNIGRRQRTDAAKCGQMLSQCVPIFPGSASDLDMCKVLPQHVACVENYISKCRGMIGEDAVINVRMAYEETQAKCELLPKCPQLERCRRVSSAVASNHKTVENFCKADSTLSQCVGQALAACNNTLSSEERIVKSNLDRVVDWLDEFCVTMNDGSKSLASCDEMMICDVHIEQMATDNSTSWCRLMSSLVECSNSAVAKCQLNELIVDLEDLHSQARNIFCSEDDMEEKHSGPLPDITPEADSKTSQVTTQVTKSDRITDEDDGDDDDDDGNEATGIEGGAAASKKASENGSAILCMPVLLATILPLLTMTLYLR
ncbi:hypothetical protein BsWGS_07997 [Bradybaena similaris]